MKLYKLYDWDTNSGGNLEKYVNRFVLRYDNGLTFISSFKPCWIKCNNLQETIGLTRSWAFMIRGIKVTAEDILVESSELEYLVIKGTEGLKDLQKLIEDEKHAQISW